MRSLALPVNKKKEDLMSPFVKTDMKGISRINDYAYLRVPTVVEEPSLRKRNGKALPHDALPYTSRNYTPAIQPSGL